jgi:hypothetical protein
MDAVERIPIGGCWLFTKATTWDGYGRIRHNGKSRMAHNVSYELLVGDIPDGAMVLHSCDNRCCVNPHHLRVGSHEENMRDMTMRNRAARPSGVKNAEAKLTDAEVEQIRKTYAIGGVSQRSLADRFGVCQQLVSQIIVRKIWAHI